MQSVTGKFRYIIHVVQHRTTGLLCWIIIVLIPGVASGQANDIPEVRVDSVDYLDESGHRLRKRLGKSLELLARQHYVTLKLKTAKPMSVMYRMDDLDKEWFYAESTEHIHYAHLAGGTYLFRCKIIGQDNEYQLPIIVDNPVWTQWWFWPTLVLYVVGVVSIAIYLLLQYRFRQRLRLYQARDRIARDLHDDMGSYLSSISILSQNAHRSATKDPIKTQATLDRIGRTARQVMDSMGDIVWSINPDHDSMAQVIARMTDVASSLFAGGTEHTTTVALEMNVADEVRQMSLSAECRRDFFLIYKEAITNVARYAQASRVRVALRREDGWLVLTVQDDGRGFDPQNPIRLNPSGGNGLRNMQARAALLNGTLAVESAEGQGSTVTLRFPA